MLIRAILGLEEHLKTGLLFSLEPLRFTEKTDDWIFKSKAPGHQQAGRRSLV